MNTQIHSPYHHVTKFNLRGVSMLAILPMLPAGCSTSSLFQAPSPTPIPITLPPGLYDKPQKEF